MMSIHALHRDVSSDQPLPLPSVPPRQARGGAGLTVLILLLAAAAAAGAWYGFFREGETAATDMALTDPIQRGPMRVTISESGSLEALDAHSIVNKVEGRTVIDYIVPEGTVLTRDDVDNKTVLVRLNSANLVEKRIRQEIEVAAAQDAYKNAETNLEIQIHQNASDIRKARLKGHFANLDLKRYVGRPFADKLTESYAAASAQAPEATDGTADGRGGLASAGLLRLISSLLSSEGLDGEALQKIRELKSTIFLAKEELGRAAEKKTQSERLLAKGYVSAEEFELDKLALERREIADEQAKTANAQFVAYDFPKQVAKLLSEVIEAEDGILRATKRAAANEAQKKSALISKQKQKELKDRRLQSYVDQEKYCVLHASVPGLIVYASSGREHRWGNQERISEGATVREGQEIIQIPSPKSLGARISVHETFIDRVRKGQDAWITVDAMPGVRIPAVVKSVARLPNPADRWLNPDLKVYTTILVFKDEQASLKPGMSAEVEILITRLEEVLAVPMQSVAGTVEKPAVYVWSPSGAIRKRVELGLASEHFVEIKTGLEAGDRLLLAPPREKNAALDESAKRGDKAGSRPPDAPSAGKTGTRKHAPGKRGTGRPGTGKPGGRKKRNSKVSGSKNSGSKNSGRKAPGSVGKTEAR